MKIANMSNASNDKSATTFGYNKTLNRLVIKTLKEDTSAYNTSLLRLNKLCNQTEDTLDVQTRFRPHDEDGCYDEVTDKFIYLFVDLKSKLAECLTESFPKLHFASREAQQYEQDMGGDSLHWKNELTDILKDIEEDERFTVVRK